MHSILLEAKFTLKTCAIYACICLSLNTWSWRQSYRIREYSWFAQPWRRPGIFLSNIWNMGMLQEHDCVDVRWPEQLYFLRSDEGGRILMVSFYECPVYVSRVSVMMPRDFIHSDFILDWLADGHKTLIWRGYEPVMLRNRVRIAMPARPNQSGKRSSYFYVPCSCGCWLLGRFLRCFFKA